MFNCNLVVLSYHQFVVNESAYVFSRTLNQFEHDIRKKVFDWVTIDDGRACTIEACALLQQYNIRAKLFIATSLVGTPGYCNWDDLKALSKFHDIENHSNYHKDHTQVVYERQIESIDIAQKQITQYIGKPPRYFVPPYNKYNPDTEMAALTLGLVLIKNRITITKDSK